GGLESVHYVDVAEHLDSSELLLTGWFSASSVGSTGQRAKTYARARKSFAGSRPANSPPVGRPDGAERARHRPSAGGDASLAGFGG
ncbi:MAG: hypothetical protein WBK99_08450, partial [Solirubrobacterales bacterium]